MDWDMLFAMLKRFKIGTSVNPNLCQLPLNIQMEFDINPFDIWNKLNISDKPKHRKPGHTSQGPPKKGLSGLMKSSGVAGVELTYCRATGSVLTEEPAASSRMEMSEVRESAH